MDIGGARRAEADAGVEAGVRCNALGHAKWDEAADGAQDFFGDLGVGEGTEDLRFRILEIGFRI